MVAANTDCLPAGEGGRGARIPEASPQKTAYLSWNIFLAILTAGGVYKDQRTAAQEAETTRRAGSWDPTGPVIGYGARRLSDRDICGLKPNRSVTYGCGCVDMVR